MIVARFAGSLPPPALLSRIRTGQVGGVILFADNVSGTAAATAALTSELQQAAAEGGNPPLLIMTDQEGGEVRRLSWAPPRLAPAAIDTSALARSEGEATGQALRAVGVNVDLAPVADVERVTGSFLGARSFGANPALVAARACAFAEGVAAAGVAFTLKHFPGLGRALTSTDVQPTTVDAPASSLREDYAAYRVCGSSPGALVMISSASYPSLTGSAEPAVLAPEIYHRELRLATGGGEPLTISDDLQAAGLAGQVAPAQHAIEAGLDLLLYAQTEAGSASAYRTLLAQARGGAIDGARLLAADRAIQAVKDEVGEVG
jgi:beta-N-acetylhexosaminidase